MDGSAPVEGRKFKIPAWLTTVLVVGMMTLFLGVIVANTAYINFPTDPDDYDDNPEDFEKDENLEQDISSMQYLIGATFINAGVGMILIFMLLGVVANETINQRPRIVMLVASVSLLTIWIYFSLLSGLLSRVTWISP